MKRNAEQLCLFWLTTQKNCWDNLASTNQAWLKQNSSSSVFASWGEIKMLGFSWAVQDWIGFNFFGSGLDSEWKISWSANFCRVAENSYKNGYQVRKNWIGNIDFATTALNCGCEFRTSQAISAKFQKFGSKTSNLATLIYANCFYSCELRCSRAEWMILPFCFYLTNQGVWRTRRTPAGSKLVIDETIAQSRSLFLQLWASLFQCWINFTPMLLLSDKPGCAMFQAHTPNLMDKIIAQSRRFFCSCELCCSRAE